MLLAIDICADNLFIAQGNVSSGSVDLQLCDEAELQDGTVDDGDIKNHAALVMTLTKLLSAHPLKASSAAITFSSGMVLSRRLTLPPAKPVEMAAMVRSQMSQAVNSPEDFVFDYSFAKPVQPKDAPSDVWAYALEKDIVDKYYALFKSIRMRPVALDIHANSIEKLVFDASVNGAPLAGRSTLFVNVDSKYLEIHLFNGSERGFSRSAPVSAAELLLIAGNLGYSKNKKQDLGAPMLLKPEQEKTDAQQDGLDISPEALTKDPILADAARQYTGQVADELAKMNQFQLMRNSAIPVSCVYTFGNFSGIKGLSANLSQLLGCPVEQIETISRVKADGKIQIASYLNAIGALIRL